MLGSGMLGSGMLSLWGVWLQGCSTPWQAQNSPGFAPVHVESEAGSSGSGDNVPGSYFRQPAHLAQVWSVD